MPMKSPLKPEEKETIILFNEAASEVSVFTYNAAWKHYLEKEMGLKGDRAPSGAREYTFPKKLLRFPRKPRHIPPSPHRSQVLPRKAQFKGKPMPKPSSTSEINPVASGRQQKAEQLKLPGT